MTNARCHTKWHFCPVCLNPAGCSARRTAGGLGGGNRRQEEVLRKKEVRGKWFFYLNLFLWPLQWGFSLRLPHFISCCARFARACLSYVRVPLGCSDLWRRASALSVFDQSHARFWLHSSTPLAHRTPRPGRGPLWEKKKQKTCSGISATDSHMHSQSHIFLYLIPFKV